MALREEFTTSGNWLFRWRSYLPLVFLPLVIFELSKLSNRSVDEVLGTGWEVFCVALAFCGLLLRMFVVGQTPERTSGRNTREQVADTLNTTGMYSVVRHPLYLGNFLGWIAVALFAQSFLLVLAAVLAFALYYERIMFAEEQYLRARFRGDFLDWAARTPAIVPRLHGWKPSSVPFSWRLALRREYSGMFAIVVTFTALHLLRGWFQRGWIRLEPGWMLFFILGTIAYVWLRREKKNERRRSTMSRGMFGGERKA